MGCYLALILDQFDVFVQDTVLGQGLVFRSVLLVTVEDKPYTCI
jgi:hypothetical protein